jgi:protein-arginine kinase activator protein McsA
MKRQLDVSKLRKELAKAVEGEDYERAAKLRDQIKQAEG